MPQLVASAYLGDADRLGYIMGVIFSVNVKPIPLPKIYLFVRATVINRRTTNNGHRVGSPHTWARLRGLEAAVTTIATTEITTIEQVLQKK